MSRQEITGIITGTKMLKTITVSVVITCQDLNYFKIINKTKHFLVHDELNLGKLNPNVQFLKPFGFCDYIKLQTEALCVVSDSGTITEEGSLLNLPAITIRNAHERPEGMDVGTLIMSGLKKDRVLDAINVIIKQHKKVSRVVSSVPDYESSACVSKQVLRVVMSYIDYINRTVWSK